MQNASYLKYLKLSLIVFLAMLFINCGIKNVSYAYTYEEFYTIMENNVGNSNQNIMNWWNGFKGQNSLSVLQTNWKQNNTIACYGEYNAFFGWNFQITFINNDGNMYRYYDGVRWTTNKRGYQTININKNGLGATSSNLNTDNWQPPNSYLPIFNNANTSWVFITNTSIYTNNTITEETSETWYFKMYSLTSTDFEKYNARLDYSNNYILLGKITGEDLDVWRTRAILYQNNNIIASYNEIGLGGNVENGMIAQKNRYNLEDEDIYIYVRTSLLYPNKVYSLDVYYDEDEEILQWNENYTFSLESGDSGYTSQNSTNDIIQNQNQNTQNVVNVIESGNNFLNAPLDLSGENITSGDIIGALDMNFSGDPYENVWVFLIDGLRNSLVGVDREFDVEIFNRTYTINLDSFSIKLPAPLKAFLSIVSSSFMIWVIIKWIKVSIDKIQSADIDTVLQANEEERHYRFILGG